MKEFVLDVNENFAEKPLDIALVNSDLNLSRKKVRRIIDNGGVRVNNRGIWIASYKLNLYDKVYVTYNDNALEKHPEDFDVKENSILFNKHDIIAFNKPSGLASQETKNPNEMHVVSLLKTKFLLKYLFLCHRLDKETSGVLLLSRTQKGCTHILEEFREKKIKKVYLALCLGSPPAQEFTVECFLSRISQTSGKVKVVQSGGRKALTHFRVLKSDGNITYLECHPITGRSHQIRVHLFSKGMMLLGEKKYTVSLPALSKHEKEMVSLAPHHLLHCKSMSFSPAKNSPEVKVEAPLNDQFKSILEGMDWHI